MKSALRSVISALGVCAACYMLATASWQQVLTLFSVASIGWCLFAFMAETQGIPVPAERGPGTKPRLKRQQAGLIAGKAATTKDAGRAIRAPQRPVINAANVVEQPRPERIQRVYRFPMHELARASFTPVTE
ncbi:MAG: hypothetical protein P4L53_09915 [Candidatus Obscuribacterales bacterium]|nr:hypothetical protein [Candidatus Obscuribacterales bacterium]